MAAAILFAFRHPDTTWANIVAKSTQMALYNKKNNVENRSESFCHVDIIVHPSLSSTSSSTEQWKSLFVAYSSYMGEPLSKTALQNNLYDSTKDVVLCYTLDADEATAALSYLDRLVDQEIPYNYYDLPLCVLPASVGKLFPDIDYHTPTRVFCSQLVVLTLKRCLSATEKNEAIHSLIDKTNSRIVSPNSLFQKLKPFCQRLHVGPFIMGRLSVITY